MKYLLLILLVLTAQVSTADEGCIAVTNEKLCIQLEWENGPYIGAYLKNIVRFKDLSASTESTIVYKSPTGSLQFFGWMVMLSHGHGTRPVETNVLENGIYENSKIFYMDGMNGTWQFKVKIGSEEFILHSLPSN